MGDCVAFPRTLVPGPGFGFDVCMRTPYSTCSFEPPIEKGIEPGVRKIQLALVRQRHTDFGGAERFVSRTMEALATRDVGLTLVAREWARSPHYRSLTCDPFYVGSLWRDWGFARCACRALEQEHFDLVQSHERIACCDVYRAGDGVHREWLAQRGRILGPLRRAALALNPYHRYVLGAEKKLFQSPRLRAVICISRMVMEEIRFHYGVPERKLHVVYNGVDTSEFHPAVAATYREALRKSLGIAPTAPLFLFVGSGFQRKGVAVLLQAMTMLPVEACLVVVGKDKQARLFARKADQLGLGHRVRFVGGQKDVRPYYGAADALVFPTLYEPFGNVALEAMACALPVVTSTKSGAAEMVVEGENGFVRDALDVTGFAEAMRRLLDPARRAAMAAEARMRAENHTMGAMAGQLTDLYERLLSESAV